ncbi:patatin-related protein [Agromyces cerinus]|uniref:DUF3376 domain-containing protein n=1 Tax=Agromyces cerinus TaxID=33878 RepID=UPI00195B3B26|nr:DUF3376 domain-containing protein [Agromyces cerinus]MBM7831003.1 patatin-related protein [Agromyces cerinus]
MPETVEPHDYVTLHLDATSRREYGVFPTREGIDPAPPSHDAVHGADAADAPDDPNPRIFLPHGARPYAARGLRVALAMKGGVSLAVWIGGAIAELDILRRIRIFSMANDPDPRALLIRPRPEPSELEDDTDDDEHMLVRADAYARLLLARGYDRVEYDVLAGASAGGLNGVMYAVAQRAGVGLEGILGTWLTTGSAWGLLQTGKPAAFDSVFRGDEYFWSELERALRSIATGRVGTASAPHPALAAPHVVVDLSATLIDAKDTSERNAAEGHAHFRFVGSDGDSVPDRGIPGRDDDEAARGPALARLAYAARATSSFPGAFEPALIYSGDEAFDTSEPASPPDMRTVFSAHREDGRSHPFRVVDGGVLDNIPIDRALRAIRNIPANEHVNRALVYLDPSPKESSRWLIRATAYEGPAPELPPDPATTRTDPLSRFLFPILTAVRKRASGESGEDEIDAVYEARTAALVRKGRDEMLAVRLDARTSAEEASMPPAQRSIAAFARLRSTTDAEFLRMVFSRPGEWALGTNLARRPVRRALDRTSIGRFEKELRDILDRFSRDELDDGLPADAVSTGWQTLVDAAYCALTWVRALEDQAFRSVSLHAFDRALTEVDATADVSRAALREGLYAVMSEARDRRDAAVERTLDAVDAIPSIESPLSDERVRRLALVWLTSNADGPADRARLWSALDGIVGWLQHASAALGALEGQERWVESPWHRMPPAGRPLPSADLPLIFAGSGMPTATSTVRFHRIGSDTQPASVEGFRTLLDAQLLEGYRAALGKPVGELNHETVSRLLDDRELRSSSKLAGLRIANFAGFLSAAWRRNDWWWGRLDAAAGVIELLESMEPAPPVVWTAPANSDPASTSTSTSTSELGAVHDALLREMNASDEFPYADRVAPDDPDAIRATMVRGTQDLESLRSGYRVALASRAARNASAALVRGSAALSPVRISQWLLRPLLVVVPALLSPPRLILALLIVACGLMLAVREMTGELGESAGLRPGVGVASIATAVAAAFVVVRLGSAFGARRRRRRAIANHTVADSRARRVIAAAERRARTSRVVLVVLSALLIGVFFAASLQFGLWTLPFWVALLGLLGVTEVANRQLQTVAAAHRARPGRWIALTGFAVLAIVVTAMLPPMLDSLSAGLSPVVGQMAWRAIAASIVVAALSATLLAQALRPQRLLLVTLAAVVATAVTVTTTTWLASLDDRIVPVDEANLVAIDAGISTAQAWAAVMVTAWVAGTVLWWAPWFRGAGTAESVMPDDGVHDLDPGSLVPATPATTSLAGETPDEVSEGPVEREGVPDAR